MKDKRKRHISKMIRFLMTVLTSVLIVLILIIILMVSRIQGTARVVNYAGLVRGKTQRIIKLEDAGMPQDEMIADVDGYIEGLRFGSEELDLVSLDDKAFQAKMEELDAYFDTLKQEIDLVRQVGYENTNIIQKSETFFSLCDVATGLAETYAQRIATRLGQFEALTIIDIVILIFMILYELFKAFHYAKANRELKSKIYLDEATGLPNKNKCEEILTLEAEQNMAICVFDLNNLRIINNQQGHERGDLYINLFAKSLRNGVDENQFVGRCGGDEFIAFFKNVTKEDVKRNLENIKKECAKCSEIPLSYAAGFAYSNDFSKLTMRELFCQADKNMYIDKNQAKINEATEKRDLILRVIQQLKDKGYNFSDCIYCDAKIDAYFTLRASYSFFLAEDGIYSGAVEQILNELFEENKKEEYRHVLQLDYLNECLTKENPVLEISYCHQIKNTKLKGKITAALKSNAAITIGNVVGSNILNVGIILGITALIRPLHIQNSTIKYEMPFMMLVTLVLILQGINNTISRFDGIILWLFFLGYLYYIFRMTKNQTEEAEIKKTNPLFIPLGLVCLMIGSNFAVDAATNIAISLGVSQRFIGLTIVALGTSLPELVTSVTAAKKGNADIAIGNIIGSNIFNILFVVGSSALITPVPFEPNFIIDSFVAILIGLVLYICTKKTRVLDKKAGILLLITYLIYFIYLL